MTFRSRREGWRGNSGVDGVLDQLGEAVADARGGALVEAEHVLVEIGLEVLVAARAVMDAQGPTRLKLLHYKPQQRT